MSIPNFIWLPFKLIAVKNRCLDCNAAGEPDSLPEGMATERLSLPPSDVLAVEDNLTGRRSAHAVGLGVALMGPEAARGNGVDYGIRTLTEIPALLGVVPPA